MISKKLKNLFWFIFSLVLFFLFLIYVIMQFGTLTIIFYTLICLYAFIKQKTIRNPWIPGIVAFGFFLMNIAFAAIFPLLIDNFNKDLASILTAGIMIIFLIIIYKGSKKLKRT
jgi:hypothetical protein